MIEVSLPAGVAAAGKLGLGCEIREARSSDGEAMGRLGSLLIDMHHTMDPDRFIEAGPTTAGAYERFLNGQLDGTDVIILVAARSSSIFGYAYAALEGPDYMALRGPAGVLHDLVVDPERRSEGIGRMLLDAVLMCLKSRGAPRVVLATASKNEAAQQLFASSGFRPTMIEMTCELHAASRPNYRKAADSI